MDGSAYVDVMVPLHDLSLRQSATFSALVFDRRRAVSAARRKSVL
jgi:hypothetical protein